MSESIMFTLEYDHAQSTPFNVEGGHQPDGLAEESGVWIAAAGSSMLPIGTHALKEQKAWVWLVTQSGDCQFHANDIRFQMKTRDCCMIPPHTMDAVLVASQETRVIWMTIDGHLAAQFMRQMGAISHRPMKQGALPSQMKLARHIVQATVRIQASQEGASAQLQQLLWAMLASHSGQPVAMDAVLSHEIAKVVDAMRKNQYQDSFSLSDMASISRMPVETFRKRFVSEVGMPPQSYQLFCKMERAKTLLKEGYTVKQTGSEVGMNDPYHFSKTFKNIVGMSPSMYCKTTQE